MTTVAVNRNANQVLSASRRLSLFRHEGLISRAEGPFALKTTRTLTAAEVGDFNASGDFLNFFTFPTNCYLAGALVTVPDMDSDGTPSVTLDLMSGSTVLVNDDTAGQAGGVITYNGLRDVSGEIFKLKIETVATGIPTSYGDFVVTVFVYLGAPVVF